MRTTWIVLPLLAALAGGAAQAAAPLADPVREAARAQVQAALKAHDVTRAIALEEAWGNAHPADLQFRRDEPLLHALAGDGPGWARSRAALLGEWQAIRATGPRPADPSLLIDTFAAGDHQVFVEQCYAPSGPQGVLYRFVDLDADRIMGSFFAVVSPKDDDRLAAAVGQTDPVVLLDRFEPGLEQNVATFRGVPPYATLRQRVLDFYADPKPAGSTRTASPGLSTERCGF